LLWAPGLVRLQAGRPNGDVRPRVIAGSKTLLNVDDSVTVDDAGYIYVSNCGSFWTRPRSTA
jgi:hypothetical protein